MNNTIIQSINQMVSRNDTLIHLGDIGFDKPKHLFDILTRINGHIILIKGNHDSNKLLNYIEKHNYAYPFSIPKKHKQEPNRLKFTIQQVGLLERVNGITYYLTHYPLEVGETNNQLRSVCGHIHENIAPMANMINIGIDSPEIAFVTANFGTPLTLETVAELVDKKWEKWYYKYINDKEEYHLGNTK